MGLVPSGSVNPSTHGHVKIQQQKGYVLKGHRGDVGCLVCEVDGLGGVMMGGVGGVKVSGGRGGRKCPCGDDMDMFVLQGNH